MKNDWRGGRVHVNWPEICIQSISKFNLKKCSFKVLCKNGVSCCLRKIIHTATTEGFLASSPNPPLWKFQFTFILSFKSFGLFKAPSPQNFQWHSVGGGEGVWYFLEPHIVCQATSSRELAEPKCEWRVVVSWINKFLKWEAQKSVMQKHNTKRIHSYNCNK